MHDDAGAWPTNGTQDLQHALDGWFDEFSTRYPFLVGDARALSPEILAAECSPLQPGPAERFRIAIEISPDAYVLYMLTETNVGHAVARGTAREDIETWCRETLSPVFGPHPREVLFDGYYALFTKR